MATPANIQYFGSPAEFRRWLARHHGKAAELWVGYHKKATGRPSMTWPESVDEALCYGWIDGIRKTIDAERYTIRFTPRRPGSIWSAINIGRVKVLTAERRMQPEGLAAFQRRTAQKSVVYAYEQRPSELTEPYLSTFTKARKAWARFQEEPPSFRKKITWWILSAKQEATRRNRLQQVIDDMASRPPRVRKSKNKAE